MLKKRPQAKHTEINGLLFDSILEASTYKRILKTGVFDVVTQYPLILKPETREFRAITWRIDFKLTTKLGNCPPMYIEAKGVVDTEFTRTIKFLEFQNRQAYEKLLVVLPDRDKSSSKGKKNISALQRLKLNFCFLAELESVLIEQCELFA